MQRQRTACVVLYPTTHAATKALKKATALYQISPTLIYFVTQQNWISTTKKEVHSIVASYGMTLMLATRLLATFLEMTLMTVHLYRQMASVDS